MVISSLFLSFFSNDLINKLSFFFPKLRFPIADLRPSQCPEKLPWWRKCLREDFFTIYLTDLSILSSLMSGSKESKVEIITREALGSHTRNKNN